MFTKGKMKLKSQNFLASGQIQMSKNKGGEFLLEFQLIEAAGYQGPQPRVFYRGRGGVEPPK